MPNLPRLKIPPVKIPPVKIPTGKIPTVGLAKLGPLARRRGDGDAATKEPTPTVHPKIAGRRDAVADADRRRRRKIRWITLSAAGALTAVVALLFSPVMDLDHLVVEGVEGTPAAEVSAAAGLSNGTAMFGIRTIEVRDRIEDLSWVAHAEVDAVWPDRVDVRVTPHRPVAVLAATGDRPDLIVTSSGRFLEFDDAEALVPFTAGLPVLHLDATPSDPAESAEVRGVLAMLAGLRPASAAAVASATWDGDQLVLTAGPGSLEGAEFLIGGLEEAPEKSQALEAVLSGAVELACLSGIDVSVPSRVTIERRSDCVIAAP